MGKDTEDALRRLEAELLAAEDGETGYGIEDEETGYDGEDGGFDGLPPEAGWDIAPRDAYNSDAMDGDLDAYSESVRGRGRSRLTLSLIAIALSLTAAVLALIGWWTLRLGGHL